MKTKTILRIVAICVICAATLIGGCGTASASNPVYETLKNVVLKDASYYGDDVYRFYDVYDMNWEYSGRDTWGNAEYTVTVYYYKGSYNNRYYSTVYQIDEWDWTSYRAITRYKTSYSIADTQTSYSYWNGQNIRVGAYQVIRCGYGCNVDCGHNCEIYCGRGCNIDCGDSCIVHCGNGCNIAHGERCSITHGTGCNIYLAYPD